MKRILCIGLVLVMTVLLSACAEETPLSRTEMALDTVCSISLYDGKEETRLDASFSLIREYESKWSRTKAGSDVTTLNTANGVPTTVSVDTLALLQTAQFYTVLTDGAFDITTAPLTDLWKQAETADTLPDAAALQAACRHTGAEKLIIGSDTVALTDGAQIDLGGIAKGQIADQVANELKLGGCTSAVIDLGGNIVALGSKPNGEPFHIGITDPQNSDQLIATVAVSDRAVVTSGAYQRGFDIGGVHYSHILDPRTGQPVHNDLLSVTIIAPLAVDADVLSTACFVMGYEQASALLTRLDDIEAVFVRADGSVVTTGGVELV